MILFHNNHNNNHAPTRTTEHWAGDFEALPERKRMRKTGRTVSEACADEALVTEKLRTKITKNARGVTAVFARFANIENDTRADQGTDRYLASYPMMGLRGGSERDSAPIYLPPAYLSIYLSIYLSLYAYLYAHTSNSSPRHIICMSHNDDTNNTQGFQLSRRKYGFSSARPWRLRQALRD